jgi:hippurate hydrolase
MNALTQALASAEPTLIAKLEVLYKDIHQHPELSMQETRTAKMVADAMQGFGYEVTPKVGVTGVVCVM